ncbi:MAG: preprotein translocase subunit SecE [Leptospirales bacterium]|nr:preprotein translocase subunit SecE [Leptospirales bacterium]
MKTLKKAIQFVKESREELRKVSWPDKEEVTSFTGVVIVTVCLISLFLWLVDAGLMKIVRLVVN